MHDKNYINETTNELKSHIGILLFRLKIKKSYNQMLKISEMLNAPKPEKVGSLQGAVQYLWHRNNPENISITRVKLLLIMGLNTDNI